MKILKTKQTAFAAVLGIGFLLTPWTVFAQTAAVQPSAGPAPAIQPEEQPPPDQPTREQLAKLFEVMRVREQMQSMLKIFPAMIQQQMQSHATDLTAKLSGGAALTPEQQAAMAKVTNTYMEKVLSAYSFNDMVDDMAAVYQRHLSRTDVDAYIVFFQSPAGQHLLDQQPVIMQEYMPMAMKRMQGAIKGLTGDMAKDLQECIMPAEPAKDKTVQK